MISTSQTGIGKELREGSLGGRRQCLLNWYLPVRRQIWFAVVRVPRSWRMLGRLPDEPDLQLMAGLLLLLQAWKLGQISFRLKDVNGRWVEPITGPHTNSQPQVNTPSSASRHRQQWGGLCGRVSRSGLDEGRGGGPRLGGQDLREPASRSEQPQTLGWEPPA